MATATLDRRRINAPDTRARVAIPNASSHPSRSSSTEQRQAWPQFIECGTISQASGSAYLESETIKVACAVYGPRQQQQSTSGNIPAARSYTNEGDLNVDVRFATFATPQRKRPGKDQELATLAASVRMALLPAIRLDKLPKAVIDVYVTVLEANCGGLSNRIDEDGLDASTTSTIATIASCALADAGVEMYGLVIGAGAVLSKDSSILVDPSRLEGLSSRAILQLWTMPALGTVTQIEQAGRLSQKELSEMTSILQRASNGIHLTAAKAIQSAFLARERESSSSSS